MTHSPSVLLTRLRAALEGQAEALSADDFTTLERLGDERDVLVSALDAYGPADFSPADRELLNLIAALDQRIMEQGRAGLAETRGGLKDVHGGRRALTEYGRRGQNVIRNLATLDFER